MPKLNALVASLVAILPVLNGAALAHTESALPHIVKSGAASQLIVDGHPFIALAGELHNSSASSASYMESVWDGITGSHVNTILCPVYWELTERREGQFDFSLVDEHLRQARAHGVHLVLLWFGSLKNAKSTYAPPWVLSDSKRFARATTRGGQSQFDSGDPALSVFSETTVTADARAFGKLMAHLATVDSIHTVIAVQVENETGLLGDSRDRSSLADHYW